MKAYQSTSYVTVKEFESYAKPTHSLLKAQ